MPRQGGFLRRAGTPTVADQPSPTTPSAPGPAPQPHPTTVASDTVTAAGTIGAGAPLSLETPPALITAPGNGLSLAGPGNGGGVIAPQLLLNNRGASLAASPVPAWLQRGNVNFNMNVNSNMNGGGGLGRGVRPAVDLGDSEGEEEEEEEFEGDRDFTGGAVVDMQEEHGLGGVELEHEEDAEEDEEDEEDNDDGNEESVEEEEEVEGEGQERNRSPSPLPPNLREISSLASWTVSTHKPGCGVAALRHPSPTQFWQSDGPQPHTLTLHFFKLVAIVKLRVYLDFELDESYTPTRMLFLAGMGGNDLVEFASWEGEAPCGWVDISLEGVGGRSTTGSRTSMAPRKSTNLRYKKHKNRARDQAAQPASGNGSPRLIEQTTIDDPHMKSGTTRQAANDPYDLNIEDIIDHMDDNGLGYQDEEGDDYDDFEDEMDEADDPFAGNVLKAMVVQVRICENHQNGKDTHVRGFQVFARDEDRRRVAAVSAAHNSTSHRQSVGDALHEHAKDLQSEPGENGKHGPFGESIAGLDVPDWMGEPLIR